MRKLQIVLLILITQCLYAQDYEFDKVSLKELQEEFYPQDSSASAAILYKSRKTYFNSNLSSVSLETEIHQRIKIYNNDGFDKASFTVNLYKSRSSRETLKKVKAYTYNLVDGKQEKTELEKDQIFKSEYSYNYNQVKFTMPNVKEGSVLEVKYTISSPFYYNIDEFKFQSDIPIKKLQAEIRTPEGFNFSPKTKGYIPFYPKRSSKRDNRLGMVVDILNYELANVPALKEESYVNNIDNYRAGVFFELVSVNIPGRVSKYYAQSWSDVAKTIGSENDYEKELDRTKSFDDDVDAIIAENTGQIDKMKAVFKYVKQHIKWNGIDGKYFFNGIKKALKEKKGNTADVNLTLVAMLRYAGLKANPVIISTKDNLIPFFPTVDRLNYVIAYVTIGEEEYFLDATDEFSDINLLPLKDYNWQGILVDNTKMQWRLVSIDEPKIAESQYMVKIDLNDDGSIEGTSNSRFKNHNAYKFRQAYKDQDMDAFISSREELFDNIEISNYEVTNAEDYETYISESFEFYKDEAVDFLDNKIYLQPLFFLKLTENPFKLEKREYPVDFGHPFKDRYFMTVNLPEGYNVESLPEPMSMSMPDNLGLFKFKASAIGNKIQLSVSFEIKKSMIGAQNYLILKEFFNQMIKKQAEQVVLSKV